jgi:hypothetical protein
MRRRFERGWRARLVQRRLVSQRDGELAERGRTVRPGAWPMALAHAMASAVSGNRSWMGCVPLAIASKSPACLLAGLQATTIEVAAHWTRHLVNLGNS